MHRAAQWLLILALSLSVGLQSVVVQSAAWVGMIVANSRDVSAMQSIAMTFDGQHECRVCKALDRGDSSSPKKQDASRSVKVSPMAAPLAEDFVFEPDTPFYGACTVSWGGKVPPPPQLRPPRLA